jgi:hypothetical protein
VLGCIPTRAAASLTDPPVATNAPGHRSGARWASAGATRTLWPIFTVIVKNGSSVKKDGLAAWAVALLRGLPGAPIVDGALPGSVEDGSLRFPDAGLVLRVEQKAHVDAVVAHSIGAGPAVRPEPLLVVARTTTSGAREILESHGIGYVDGAGNAAIDLPGLHVRTGSFTASAVIAPAPRSSASPRLAGKAGLIAQALILEPQRAWTLDAMAERAGASTALAHRVFTRLERATVLAADGRGPRKTRRVASREPSWTSGQRRRTSRRSGGPRRTRSCAAMGPRGLLAAGGT